MNQILETYDYWGRASRTANDTHSKKNFYFFVFIFSLIIFCCLLIYLFSSIITRLYHLRTTQLIQEKYNLVSLYTRSTNYTTVKLSDTISIIGLIEIPSINVSYPILEKASKELLKISVCRFNGPFPNRIGNMCLAGHNYRNSSMFSKLNCLKKGDSIFITDLNNVRLEYVVYDKFKVKETDLDCIKNTSDVQLTLITCREINNKERIVLKAKVKG